MPKPKENIIDKILKDKKIEEFLKVFPNNAGSWGYDPWGFNIKGFRRTIGFVRFLYEKYFRVEAFGLENIPKDGRCLIIANHSGQLPIDGALIGYALLTNTNGPRAAKAMVEKFLPSVPFIGNWLNSLGAVIGDTTNCERMLEMEEAIVVFPEGVRGSGKIYNKKYQLQKFGNGFMHLAMKHNTPIIPVGVVGCEETIISFADMKGLAKMLSLPYAPLILPAILPAKVYLHFGKPMYFENDTFLNDEIESRVDKVKIEINQLIQKGLTKRKTVFEK